MSAKARFPSIEDVLGPGGRLSSLLEGYEYRPQQLEASRAIERAIADHAIALVEAGTGVGKSLAYLVPAAGAISRGKKVVISTHTIALQTQLVEKDIPLAARLLPEAGIKAALMKGRGQYLCLQEMEAKREELYHSADPLFHRIRQWARTTESGDAAELPFSYPAWYEIAANQDTCGAQECRLFNDCFYYRMRRVAASCNLIVVNHALLLSDLLVRSEEPEATIIPEYDVLILDEAHHLEDVATTCSSLEIADNAVPQLVERLRRIRGKRLDAELLASLVDLNNQLFAFFESDRREFFFSDILDAANRQEMLGVGSRLCVAIEAAQAAVVERAKEADEKAKDHLEGLGRVAGRLRENLHTLLYDESAEYIRWARREPIAMHSAGRVGELRTTLAYSPVSPGSGLATTLWNSGKGIILTSATLSTSEGFSYLRSRLGLPRDTRETQVGSPFDYRSQALLYVPAHLPEPPRASDPEYAELVADEIERLVHLSQGRAFLLFTSRRALGEVYGLLKERLRFPLLKQGEMPTGQLLEQFRQQPGACLFGLQSFWEGADVPGDALVCVVIDRLPFAPPDSPLQRARTDQVKEQGGDWFREYSVPQAQLRLKQGFGRLIRTATDRGIVCVLDTRLITKWYGQDFIRALPPVRRASQWGRVVQFWRNALANGRAGEEPPEDPL